MTRRLLPSFIIVLVAFGAVPVAVLSGPAPGDPSPPAGVFPLSEVHPGLQVIVRTVLQGDEIEEIPAEVIGVMENALGPAQSLILVRLNGERAAFAGVAAGMSGSPVYAGDRLIGALAYRIGQFTKEAIGGITPIEYMLEIPNRSGGVGAGRSKERPSSGATPAPTESAPRRIPLAADYFSSASGGVESALVPIETPMVVTGVPEEILRHFARQFGELGAFALSGAGGSAGDTLSPPRPVRPGDAIAAQLMRGDISVAATGTVTRVDGDRVLAFGHPFLLSGEADLPMARAEIYMTLASLAGSTKLSRVRETIGTWEQIRLPGSSGVTSRVPPMIPVSVAVKTPLRSASYTYEVATQRDWSPTLVAMSIASSLVNTTAFTDESTLSVSGRFRLEGHPDVVIQDLYTGFGQGASAAVGVAQDMQGLFAAVFQNRFEVPTVRSVEIAAEGIEESRLTFVEGVWPSRNEAAPGEEVRYSVRLRSYRGEHATKTFTFRIPEGVPRGDLQIFVGGNDYLLAAERAILARRVAGSDSLDQIIAIVNNLRSSDSIYARAVRRLSGAVVQSQVLPALPPSVLTTLRSNRGSGEVALIAETTLWEDRMPVGSIVTGGATLLLKVR